jgi:hypothetical protein
MQPCTTVQNCSRYLCVSAAVARPGEDAVGEDGVGAGHGPWRGHGVHQRWPRHRRPGAHRRAPLPQGRPRHVRRRRPRHRRRRLPRRRARGGVRVAHRVRPIPLLRQRRVPAGGRSQARADALAVRPTLTTKVTTCLHSALIEMRIFSFFPLRAR